MPAGLVWCPDGAFGVELGHAGFGGEAGAVALQDAFAFGAADGFADDSVNAQHGLWWSFGFELGACDARQGPADA